MHGHEGAAGDGAGAAGDGPAPVTVMGLGGMGQALAAAFLAAGHPTTVWNRSPGKADPLAGRGAVLAASPADAVAASGLVVVCVLDYAAARGVLEAAGDALSGRVLVNLTSGTPGQAREMAEWVAGRGGDYLDGGIMAVPPLIGTPHSLVLYGGSAGAFEAHRGALEVLGEARFVGADAGLAPLLDIALLCGMYGMLGGALHAMALAGTEGLGAQEFTSSLLMPWLAAMAETLPGLARQVDTGAYDVDVVANLGMQAAGFGNLVRTSREQGLSAELLTPIGALMERRVAAGHGGDDLSGIIELIRQPAAAHSSGA